MSSIVSLHHINVEVKDLERAKKWWTDVFGCEPVDRGPGIGVVANQLFIGTNEVHFSDLGEDAVALPLGHNAMEVKDFDGFIKHIEGMNIPYFTAANRATPGVSDRPDGSFATFIADSEENIIELTSHGAGLRWAKSN